ncbi:ABC transporter substrate-binding protein [Burkholderia cenocepacia]|uniref:Bacterial extracellular solute-binding s, 3 family protein n=2 Tax=Burkholderia cepacia complex TaxID=87882 RepID=A0AAN0RMU2_9BURK|nr:ABC transporter substrate-binding protein [Burkholderia pseudomultivorans]AIO30418.1 bacterial extracellular solute-binding s, 3 family protein [Burkholderia cenocepacia]KWF65511.1 hypothetical protein WT57_18440 [Burkholderia pseudomultivorans]
MNIKRLGMLLTLCALSTAASAQATSDIVRIGVDPNFPPFEFKSADGRLTGLDIDLGNAICQDIGVKCEWVEHDFDHIIPGLKAKKFDIILSAMRATEDRRKVIDFSDTLYHIPVAMIAATTSGLAPTGDSLRGKRLGVTKGTALEAYVKGKWGSKAEVMAYPTDAQLYDALASGKIDAAIQDKAQAEYFFLTKPAGQNFAFTGPDDFDDARLKNDDVAIGIRKDDAQLKDRINKAIADIRANGLYRTISRKYISFDVSGN